MRGLVILLMLAAAGPAAAQPYLGLQLSRDAQAAADAQAARSRDIAVTNELSALQAHAQTDQALANLQAARISPTVPTVPFNPKAPPPVIDPRQIASIPDAALAASNARIRAAADNRK
jgi:hypothetical protein